MIYSSPYFTEEHDQLRGLIRKYVENEVIPVAHEWEEAGRTPRSVLKAFGEMGLLGLTYEDKYGGMEMDTVATAILAEELGRSTFGGFAVTILVHTDMASPHLHNAGTQAQLDKYMPGIISGDILTAVCISEPDAGSDVAGIKTRARKDGDEWVINGSKMYITNGVHADLYVVVTKTDTEAKGSRGVTVFLVEKGTPGFEVSRALEKFGWHSSDTALLSFDNVRVPEENILGEVNKGFYSVMKNLQNERIVLGAQAMGEAQKALELTVDYVKTREAFGGVLWDKQTIRQRLAARMAEVEAGRQLVYHAAWLDAQGHEITKEVSMVKAYCGELVNKVMYDCQQFHGGFGYIRESAIERMTRDARIQSVGGGATEVMLEEIAKRV